MKKLFLIIATLVAFNANAESWAMPNEGGGEITLQSEKCKADGGKYPALKNAYSWTNQIYFEGCWAVIDGNIHVIWVLPDGTGQRKVYNINSFTRKI